MNAFDLWTKSFRVFKWSRFMRGKNHSVDSLHWLDASNWRWFWKITMFVLFTWQWAYLPPESLSFAPFCRLFCYMAAKISPCRKCLWLRTYSISFRRQYVKFSFDAYPRPVKRTWLQTFLEYEEWSTTTESESHQKTIMEEMESRNIVISMKNATAEWSAVAGMTKDSKKWRTNGLWFDLQVQRMDLAYRWIWWCTFLLDSFCTFFWWRIKVCADFLKQY